MSCIFGCFDTILRFCIQDADIHLDTGYSYKATLSVDENDLCLGV